MHQQAKSSFSPVAGPWRRPAYLSHLKQNKYYHHISTLFCHLSTKIQNQLTFLTLVLGQTARILGPRFFLVPISSWNLIHSWTMMNCQKKSSPELSKNLPTLSESGSTLFKQTTALLHPHRVPVMSFLWGLVLRSRKGWYPTSHCVAVSESRTWMELGRHLSVPRSNIIYGGKLWDRTLTQTKLPRRYSMVGILPSPQPIQIRGMQSQITPALCSIQSTCFTTCRRSWSLGLWSDLSPWRTFLSKSTEVLLARSLKLVRSGEGSWWIARNCLVELISLLILGHTETPPGNSRCPTRCPSLTPSSRLVRSSPDTRSSSGSSTCPDGIDKFNLTRPLSSTSQSVGRVKFIWTPVYLLAIGVPPLRHKGSSGQCAGFTGHNFHLTKARSMEDLLVRVHPIVSVETTSRNPTSMTLWALAPNRSPLITSALSWPSQTISALNSPLPPDTFLLRDRYVFVLDWSTTPTKTQYHSPRQNWRRWSNCCVTGSKNPRLQRGNWRPSPESCSTLVMCSLQAGSFSIGSWQQKEELLDVSETIEASISTWRKHFVKIFDGGWTLSSSGTVSRFLFTNLRTTLRWTLVPMAGGGTNRVSGLIIMVLISTFQFVLRSIYTISIYRTWNFSLTSLSHACGVPSCATNTSLSGRTMRPAFGWLKTVDLLMIDDSRWRAFTPSLKSNWSIGLNRRGSQQRTTGSQTPCPDPPQLNVASFGRISRVVSGPVQSNVQLHLKCSHFNILTGFYRDLAKKMRFVQSKAWAPNTYKALKSEWRTFRIYCGEAGITTLPIPECEICYFAIWLTSTGRIKTRASLAQYVSAIRTIHKMLRLKEIPTPSQYGPLDMILKGTRRIAQHRVKKSLPVTPLSLEISSIPHNHPFLVPHPTSTTLSWKFTSPSP